MKPAPSVANESQRVEALRTYRLLDTLPEQALDDLTELAAAICNVPVALISLVDENRQWFKSKVGIAFEGTPREVSFCGHAIEGRDLFIVGDALKDSRFADNPLVTGEPHIRFYAGAPLVTPDGHAIGALCVIDHKPRRLKPAQMEALRVLGRQVMAQFELRRTARELAESESRIRRTVAAANVGLWEWDIQKNSVWYSAEWKSQIGYEEHEIAGHYEEWLSRVHPDDLKAAQARIDAFLANPWPDYESEFRLRHKDGSYRWILARASLVRDAAGKPLRMLGSHLDVTERRQAELARIESEQQYHRLFANHPHPMWVYDIGTLRFLAANDAAVARYGYSREEFLAMTIKDIRPAEDVPQLLELIGSESGGFRESGTWRHRKKNGDLIAVEVTSHTTDFNGRKAGLVLALDVTARKEAEERIQQLIRVYAMLSEINQTIVRVRDDQEVLDAACRIAVEQGGFPMAWIGLADPSTNRLRVAAHAGADEETLGTLRPMIEGDEPGCAFTSRALHTAVHGVCNDIATDPDCEGWREVALARGYRSMASLPLVSGGRTAGTFNIYAGHAGFFDDQELRLLDELATDISFALDIGRRDRERRTAEDELRRRTAFFEAQVESAPDGILVVDTEGRKVIQNRRFNELWKIPPEIAAEPDDSVQLQFASEKTRDPRAFAERVDWLLSHPGEVSRDLVELVDGTVLERSSAPVLGVAGKHYGRIWTFRDITGQRKLEAQFRQSQKMEAIGQLAGGVAHDFNNILAAIMMQADLASSSEGLPDDARELLDEIKGATERAANLTRQLLAFSRRQIMQSRPLDLNEIVTGLAKMFQRVLGEDIELQINLHPRPARTLADAGMIDQVLLNLVINARDAMPGGGRLTITTGEMDLGEAEAKDDPEATPGRHAWFSVSDTGCGIPEENLPQIFEPFFTTKEPGKGTGLGLATVFGIVKQHGGWITTASKVGRGTTFKISLPAIEPGDGETSDSRLTEPAGGSEKILLVEDEPAVRMFTRMILERKGYRVVEADNGPEALKRWEQAAGEIDLLFTDIVMPEGMSGTALAAELLARKPGLKIIYTSGYSAEMAGRELMLQDGQNYIQKPCPPQNILRTVRQALDEGFRDAKT